MAPLKQATALCNNYCLIFGIILQECTLMLQYNLSQFADIFIYCTQIT